MMDDSAKDHDNSLALARAFMLPNDVANLATEGSEKICDLLIMQQVYITGVLARLVFLKLFFFTFEYLMFFTLSSRELLLFQSK